MASSIELAPWERQQLRRWAAARGTPAAVAMRCRIVMGVVDGKTDVDIARELSINRKTVILWRRRFVERRLEGLWEIAPGRGWKANADKIDAIVAASLGDPAGRQSCRTMANIHGVSKSTIQNIWRAQGLGPHRVRDSGLCGGCEALKSVTDVVGLYVNPPQQAIVLCVDEESQIGTLDHTQRGLRLRKSRFGKDGGGEGTRTVFDALGELEGKVAGHCCQRQRDREFVKFLRAVDEEFAGDVLLHLVMGNYGMHAHERVRDWLERHPRFVDHSVPAGFGWLKLVERWVSDLDSKTVRRDVFGGVEELQAAVEEFGAGAGVVAGPFVWMGERETATKRVLGKKRRRAVQS